jgi:ammonium transporter, Amt family
VFLVPSWRLPLSHSANANERATLITGAAGGKGKLGPFLLFAFCWTTLVYDPIAYWSWNRHGWLKKKGSLDWAGGTPVHISSGAAALSYSLWLRSPRTQRGTPREPRGDACQPHQLHPHNMTYALLGTAFCWVGWFGFNAGSALRADMRATSAFVATNLAAVTGGLTWVLIEIGFGREKADGKRRWSSIGFSMGVFSALVAITPAAGFVSPWRRRGARCCAKLPLRYRCALGPASS